MEQKTFSNIQTNFDFTKKLKKIHIIKRNLLYLTNIPEDITLSLLLSNQFLGQYGKIIKSCIKKNNSKNAIKNSFTALITFQKEIDTAFAILALNRFKINKNVLYASFGLTRFCSSFLQNQKCKSKKCYFLHFEPEEEDVISGKENLIKDQNLNEENVLKFVLKSKFQSDISNFLKNGSNLEGSNFFPTKETSLKKLKKFLKQNNKQIIKKKNQKFINFSLCEKDKDYCLEKNINRKKSHYIFSEIQKKKDIFNPLKIKKNEKNVLRKKIFFSSESEKESFNENNNKSEILHKDLFNLKNNEVNSSISIEDTNNVIKNKFMLKEKELEKKNNNSLISKMRNNIKKKKLKLRKNQFFSYEKESSHNTYFDLKNNQIFEFEKKNCIQDENLKKKNTILNKAKNKSKKINNFPKSNHFFSSKKQNDLNCQEKNIYFKNENKIIFKNENEKTFKNQKLISESEESTLHTIDSEKEISLMEKFFSKNLKRRIFGIKKKFQYTFVCKKTELESSKGFWGKIDYIFNSENPWSSDFKITLLK